MIRVNGDPIWRGKPAKAKKAPVTKQSAKPYSPTVTKRRKVKAPPKPKTGRPRVYATRADRQRAYRERKANEEA